MTPDEERLASIISNINDHAEHVHYCEETKFLLQLLDCRVKTQYAAGYRAGVEAAKLAVLCFGQGGDTSSEVAQAYAKGRVDSYNDIQVLISGKGEKV